VDEDEHRIDMHGDEGRLSRLGGAREANRCG
jgi:hypothetical protein